MCQCLALCLGLLHIGLRCQSGCPCGGAECWFGLGRSGATGLYGAFDPQAYAMPTAPTPAQASAALQTLTALLSEFDFATPHDQAAALGGMLTAIIRAWLAAGSPITACQNVVSFGQWSQWVRQPLLWLGQADPAHSVFTQLAQDPDRELLGRLLRAWFSAFGSTPAMVRDAAAQPNPDMQDAMRDIADELGGINRRRLGKWIARRAGVIVGGLRFERASGHTAAERWLAMPVVVA